jgi:hypothetical protein
MEETYERGMERGERVDQSAHACNAFAFEEVYFEAIVAKFVGKRLASFPFSPPPLPIVPDLQGVETQTRSAHQRGYARV